MKRINSEQIHQLVEDFIERRNYSEIKPKLMKRKVCSLKTLALNGSLIRNESQPNVISLTSSVGDFSLISENAFKHFLNYVTNSGSESIGQQLSQLNFPLFVYLFIELFECGHKAAARRFVRDHKNHFQDSLNANIIESMVSSLNALTLDSNLKTFKNSKYCVKLSADCYSQLKSYFRQINDLVIEQMLNSCLEINIFSTMNASESEIPESYSGGSQTRATNPFHELDFVSPNAKAFQTNESNSDRDLLFSAINSVRNLDPCLPSTCLYSIQTSNICSLGVTHDLQYVCGGFENSRINLWKYSCDVFNKSQTNFEVKHKSSEIRLNIIDHNIIEDESIDQNISTNLNDSVGDKRIKVLRGHSGPVYGLSFVPKTNLLLSCSCDTTVRAWDTNSGQNVALYDGHLYPVWSIDSCLLGNYFATGCKDSVMCLWTTERSFPLRKYCGHTLDIDCVKFHPNCCYIATGSGDKEIKLWDVQQTRAVRTFVGHLGSVYCLAFSSSGKYLASAGEDRKVKLWDISSGKLIKDFTGHTDVIYSISFNFNDELLASCGADRSLKLWNVNKTTNSSKSTVNIGDNHENSSLRNQSNPGLVSSLQLDADNLIHTEFMPHNLLLSFGTKV